jgi:hypothetical protein
MQAQAVQVRRTYRLGMRSWLLIALLVASFAVGADVALMGGDAATIVPSGTYQWTRPHGAIAAGVFADAAWTGRWTRPHSAIAGGTSGTSRAHRDRTR